MKKEELSLEKQNLKTTQNLIEENLVNKAKELVDYNKAYDELVEYISETFAVMDENEKVAHNELLTKCIAPIESAELAVERLKKQKINPYFGRFDFGEKGSPIQKFYIGINNLFGEDRALPYVYDWRAPISNLFYESGLGSASYEAPDGKIEGEVTLKRQFKIVDSKLKLCFDTDERVGDEILEQTLASNSSEKMKNIVSTLQREQNKIVRSDKNNILIQGVAGSGKTSIALHKVAYLLYKDRDKLKSSDILIVSPNKIFSEFIAGVLPELGEENIEETSIKKIYQTELQPYLTEKLERREEMLESLLTDRERQKEVEIKFSASFLDKLLVFAESYLVAHFTPTDFVVGKTVIKKELIDDLYNNKYRGKTPATRLLWIADYIAETLGFTEQNSEMSERIIRLLYPMFDNMEITNLYHEFLHTLDIHFELTSDGKIAYEDVAPLLLLKFYLLGIKTRPEIKYLIIDEMQDYSFCEFYVLSQIFSCRKIVLGDIYQNAFISRDKEFLLELKEFIGADEIVNLSTCYRSSYEIAQFASTFLPPNTLVAIPRHGKEVEIIKLAKEGSENKKITQIVQNITEKNPKYRIGVLTLTQKATLNLFANLSEIDDIDIVNQSASASSSRVIVSPIVSVKGLEYDAVILCMNSKLKIPKEMINRLKFIGTTRALHELYVLTD